MVMKNKNQPLFGKDGKPRMPGQIGDTKVTLIDKNYDWGIYVWKKSNGKWFTDGNGNILNIPSMKGDLSRIAELKQAAAYYGEPDGEAYFFAGMGRVTDEEYSEQVDRMKAGLIPNLNDLGAVQAAKDTIAKYGDEE
jgi:hypothetical protein